MRSDRDVILLRLGAAAYFAIICAYAAHRFILMYAGEESVSKLGYLQIAIFLFFAVAGLYLARNLNEGRDRAAALFYGVFYTIRVATCFTSGVISTVLCGAGLIAIFIGVLILILGSLRQSQKGGLSI